MRFFLLGSILAAILYRCPWVSGPGHSNANPEPAGLRHRAEALGPTADLDPAILFLDHIAPSGPGQARRQESKRAGPWRLTRLENQLLIPLDEKNLKNRRAPGSFFFVEP